MPASADSSGMPRRAGRLLKIALVALMAALLVGTVVGFGRTLVDDGQDILYGLASHGWSGTVGTVESSYVDSKGAGSGLVYFPRINYRYEVGGRSMRSERIGTTSAYEGPDQVVAAYPAGAEVLVYHDSSGTEAVLERGISVAEVARFVFMLLVTLVFGVFYVTLLHLATTTPVAEYLAQLGVIRRMGYRRARDNREEFERQLQAERAMEAEIAERLREQAARRDRD